MVTSMPLFVINVTSFSAVLVYLSLVVYFDKMHFYSCPGIFGNSDDPNVKPTWQIAAKQFNNYTTAGLTSEDTQLASLLDYDFVRADNDKWHLMVMTYEGLFDYTRRMFPKLSLYLDGKAVDGNSMLEQGRLALATIVCIYRHKSWCLTEINLVAIGICKSQTAIYAYKYKIIKMHLYSDPNKAILIHFNVVRNGKAIVVA